MKQKSSLSLRRLAAPLILGLTFVIATVGGIAQLCPAAVQAAAELSADQSTGKRLRVIDNPIGLLQNSTGFTTTNQTASLEGNKSFPSINGDGTKIAYVIDNNISFIIKTIDKPEGKAEIIPVTDDGQINAAPSVNENGTLVAFHSTGCNACGNPDGNYEIVRAQITDTTVSSTLVTSTPGTIRPSLNLFPSINNNGNVIAFMSDHDLDLMGDNTDHNLEIFLYDGTVQQVTNTPAGVINQAPALSGDGNFIAFVSNGDLDDYDKDNSGVKNNSEIFLYNRNNEKFTQVTDTSNGINNSQPAISDDGQFIVFVSNGELDPSPIRNNSDKNQEIFIYDGISDRIIQLTNTGLGISNKQPDISGNGLTIVYVSDENGHDEIYLAQLALPELSVSTLQVTTTGPTVTNRYPSVNTSGDTIAYASNDNEDGSFDIWTAVRDIVDLKITKTAQPDPAKIGEPLSYTLVITNAGPVAAQFVTVTDRLPPQVNVENLGLDHGCTLSDFVVTCLEKNLPKGSTATITIVVTPTVLGTITNTAAITSTSVDFDPSNNEAMPLSTEVRSVATLVVTKTVSPATIQKDSPVVYTIVITNEGGPYTATDITLIDTLPKEIYPKGIFNDDADNDFGHSNKNNLELGNDNILRLAGTNTSGSYIRLIDAETSVNWDQIAWTPQRPIGRELPDFGQRDIDYPQGVNMADNSLLLHLNERTFFSFGYFFNDRSKRNNFVKCYYYYDYDYCPGLLEDLGKFKHALNFDGIDDYLDTSLKIDQSSSSDGVTMMAWVRPTGVSFGRHHVISSDNGGFDWSLLREGNLWYVFTGAQSRSTGFAVDINTWQHIAAVFDPNTKTVRFYKNGQQIELSSYDTSLDTNYINIGRNPGFGEYFDGYIDEVAIFSKPLDGEEINDIYLRGAMDLILDVQSCNDPNCEGGNDSLIKRFTEEGSASNSPPSFSLGLPQNRYLRYTMTLKKDPEATSSTGLQRVSITRDDFSGLKITKDSQSLACDVGSSVVCNLGDLSKGSALKVTITSTATEVADMVNTARVTSTAFLSGENSMIDLTATASSMLSSVNLIFTKTAPTSILAGAQFNYTITVKNLSSEAIAAGIVITDTLPSQIQTNNVQILSGLCSDDKNGTIICNLENLAPGSTQTIVLNVKHVGPDLSLNEAKITTANPGFGERSFLSNPTTIVSATDLIVSKVVTPNLVTAGNPLTYTIIVKNLGPLDANNVTLTDTLVADIPVAFKVIRSTPSPVTTNCDLDSDILITCILTFDSLNVNSSITTTILVTPSEEGTILNGVTVASDLPDPEPANNTPPALNTGPELDQSFLPIVFKQKAILTSLRAKIIYLPLLSKSNNK